MSKINVEYGYFEAMEEIIKDKNKEFENNPTKITNGEPMVLIMFFSKESKSISVRCKKRFMKVKNDDGKYEYKKEIKPFINESWTKTKWTLIEKKQYNVRVYNAIDNKLISSEIVVMTKEEIENYRKELFNKGKVEEDIKSGIGEGIVLFKINKYEHEIVSEELITN